MVCAQCGSENSVDSTQCTQCKAPLGSAPAGTPAVLGDGAGMRMLLPVGRSGWAIAAGYTGLLSLLGIFAPFALILGLVAVVDIRRHPEKHGLGRAIFGIVMGGGVTALLAVAYLT